MNNRFGRCNSFTFVTIENNEIIEVKSVANDAQGGSGIQATQIIGNTGATEVIVGNLGPNVMSSLSVLNLKIYQAMSYAEPVVDYAPESVASQVINKIYAQSKHNLSKL
jgi:predicted Fe-Mo cluster-binding NifX family protein